MQKFTDIPEIQDLIDDFLRRHKSFVIENMEEVDAAVEGQKTRFYKFKCWMIWGHLLKANGVCKRCGKILEVKK